MHVILYYKKTSKIAEQQGLNMYKATKLKKGKPTKLKETQTN